VNAKLYPVTTDTETTEAVEAAREALNAHETIVIPTDTVYGIACDAFSHQGVSKLLADKGRSRTMPPPVLIFDLAALAGVADEIPNDVYDLGNKFWPGALTIILYSYPSLTWDLGETQGTVAVRVPDDKFALKLLTEHGPLAVSSANKTGQPAAANAKEALWGRTSRLLWTMVLVLHRRKTEALAKANRPQFWTVLRLLMSWSVKGLLPLKSFVRLCLQL